MYVAMILNRRSTFACSHVPRTSRAIHLEVVTDLTVETFLLAFRKFTGRWSLPQIVVPDNASTYLEAADKLQQLLQ